MRRRKGWAWFMLTSALALFGAILSLTVLRLPAGAGIVDLGGTLLFTIVMLLFVFVGMLIVLHHTDNLIGWLLMLTGLFNQLSQFAREYSLYGGLPEAAVGTWLYGWMELMAVATLWLTLLHFPNGRLLSPRWQWVRMALLSAIFLIGVVAVMLWPHRYNPALLGMFEQEVGFGAVALIFRIAQFVLFLTVPAISLSILLRFRVARGVARQQIKWLLYAGSVLAAGSLTFVFTGTGPEHPDAPLIGVLLTVLGLVGIPVAIGIAILRYRLYDIDILIRKTLVYTVLSAVLALIYFGSVTLLQSALSAVSGQQSAIATVLSTLAIEDLFTPLRRRVQNVIDRRFYRKKYDAAQVLAQFALTARDETDLDVLTAELNRVIVETMQPDAISIYFDAEKSQ